MKRREFLQSLGTSTLLLRADELTASAREEETETHQQVETINLLNTFVRRNDTAITGLGKLQNRETTSRFRGGFPDRHGIYHVGGTAWNISSCVAGYISPQSAFYRSQQLEVLVNLAIDFVLRQQHRDGTVDLITTNFHSPPDTAFVVEPIALAISCIHRHVPGALKQFQMVASSFLLNAKRALIHGGVHTPNHRWIVCMALARIHELSPDDACIERINQWLAEGIDIDDDGQYTERSTAVYSPLVDRCLITIARLLGREELYKPVRRNLDLTRYFVRPTGELVTEVSRRQDQFRICMANGYYYSYRYLAAIDGNKSFAAMARFIEKTVGAENLSRHLIYALDDPKALVPLPAGGTVPREFERYFRESRIVRIRRREFDASIIAENSTIFTLQKGMAFLQSLRLATAFFGKGQFLAQNIRQLHNGYQLTQCLTGQYLQPLPKDELPARGDWSAMPHLARETTGLRQLIANVLIQESGDGFRIRFDVHGTDGVPVAVELGFRTDGELSGVRSIDGIENAYLADSDGGSFRVGDDVIRFSAGPSEHRWTQLRGAETKLDTKSVYFTGFTPLKFELCLS